MKIAIDISPIVYGTGVSRYTVNLVNGLLDLDKNNDYVLFGGSLRRRPEFNKYVSNWSRDGIKSVIKPLPPTLLNILWNKLHVLSIDHLIGDVDVLHSSDWTQPPTKAFKVTTVHDLVPVKYPQLSHPRLVDAHRSRLKWVIREVDRVIVPSKATLEDLEKLGYPRERIIIVPEAPDKHFKPMGDKEINRVKSKYKIVGDYLIAVGVNERKNTKSIISAFEKIRAGNNLRLVIVGHEYTKLDIPRGVVMTGHVLDEDLPALYSGASALVYPSFYEGFGLPILEAFACGLPVVTSGIGSMAEVAGNSAVLVDPYSLDSIAEGVKTAIDKKGILKKKGLRRVKNYSWEIVAKRTLEVYKSLK